MVKILSPLIIYPLIIYMIVVFVLNYNWAKARSY